MFNFRSTIERLLWDKPQKLEVINTPAIRQLFNSNFLAGRYVIEAPCSFGAWIENQDVIVSSSGWDNGGVSPFLFEMGSERNYQTILFPTALSLLK